VTVKREIGDAAVRAPKVACLSRDEPAVRRAAALALRHSLAAPDARVAFAEALSTEKDDAVAQELGEALVQTARESGDAAERTRLFGVVLRRAGDAGSDGLRFRVEDDLGASRLGDDERRALADMAASSQSFAKRSFALTVLARAARADGDGAVRHARGLLDDALARDADPAVRDLAARLLAWLPAGDSSIALLAKTVVADGAWNVRFTAVETIAACAPPEVARKTLAAATQDQDSRVAARAKELAAALEAPR
jgi:hypothetical protein